MPQQTYRFDLTGPQLLGLGSLLGVFLGWSLTVYATNKQLSSLSQLQHARNSSKRYSAKMAFKKSKNLYLSTTPTKTTDFDYSNMVRFNRQLSQIDFDDLEEEKTEGVNDMLFDKLSDKDKINGLKEEVHRLRNLLIVSEQSKMTYSGNNRLNASDIETIRAVFDSCDEDGNGSIDISSLKKLQIRLGEPLTDKEAKLLINELDPNNTGNITFNRYLMWYNSLHKGDLKKSSRYKNRFKFKKGNLMGDFDIKNIITKEVGRRATTEYRVVFHYKQKNGKLKQISPWHDIPLYHLGNDKKVNMYNFICEIPKWTRAKYEIATGEEYNPIHQDVKSGKLRYYQHGDMMFNYGALPQTWENPEHVPKDTGFPGDNDPLDAIELGTKQLKTGSCTPVKVLGVLALLDSGETDWKILVINIDDPLAHKLQDVDDIEEHMPGAIKAIREYLRIYKVCTGKAENKYALRGEAMNQKYALNVIDETHEQWKSLQSKNQRIV